MARQTARDIIEDAISQFEGEIEDLKNQLQEAQDEIKRLEKENESLMQAIPDDG